MLVSGGGGDTGTAEATPAELQKAGSQFQALSNACGGLAQSSDLQAGGQYELAAVKFVGDGASSQFVLPSSFSDAIETITQGFLGAMISAQQQCADAAMDLFQVAGDFQTADGQIPSDATPLPKVLGLPPGVTAYQTPGGQVYYKDRDGTVVGDPTAVGVQNAEDGTNNPYETIVGQTYRAATTR